MTFLGLLGLAFIGLKLGGVIHWSWWLVTAPFSLLALAALGMAVRVGFILLFQIAVEEHVRNARRNTFRKTQR